jgi:cation diffusion facilitator CzcD-associated flavoprotein CzcO
MVAPPGPGPASTVDVAIVGSGFGGIGMGYRLKQAGIHDFVILERAEGVGGTWWWNTYPGCQCDIPSHLYSLSFALNPAWSRTYPLQEEIRDHLERTAVRLGLMPHMRFRHDVQWVRWDDELRLWHIATSRGALTARVVVGAAGTFTEPRVPNIRGRETFGGHAFHSGQWDHSVALAGKRVAVVGTGASAIQIVPSIQPDVERLYVFQRTPPWVMPHTDRPITSVERWLFERLPVLQRIPRAFAYLLRECASPAFTRHTRLLAPLEWHARRHMRRQVKDRGLRKRLLPSYRIGCKRILLSNKWYPALQEANVELVTEPISEITPRGIRTLTSEVELDVVVYATGFAVTEVPFARRVVGRDGQTLSEVWEGSPRAHKNSTVPGFPNFFLVPGLQTGYSSQVFMIEAQLRYVVEALVAMRERGAHAIEVRPEAFRKWNDAVARRMPRTVWSSGGCVSWYLDRHGLSTPAWPDFTWKFRKETREFDLASYSALG